jgi:hypothetical protein
MKQSRILSLLLVTLCVGNLRAQDDVTIKSIFDAELANGKSYPMLVYLATTIGPRLSGSAGAAAGVEWGRQTMENFGFDSVWLQPVMVPHWVRGQKEIARVVNTKKMGTQEMNVCALGGSTGTGPAGILGNVVEVKTFEELKDLGKKNISGKIVFFNRPMDPTKIHTFSAYGLAVDQRVQGASEAARYGAIGMIVRSMSLDPDEDYPHTGMLRYDSTIAKIPAVAISTKHADLLSRLVATDKGFQFYLETHCQTLDDVLSYNVIGEIKGSEYRDEIILVSGHLDSWDLAQGAHDDGAGCVQAIEALRLLNVIGYKPKRTLRAVLFMNEENGLRGGQAYAHLAKLGNENHIAAIESDEGGFTPRGFSMTVTDAIRTKIKGWRPLLEPYGLTNFDNEGGGADIGPLLDQGTALIGFLPDSQRYFRYHHTKEDTIDKVDKRELELGAASITALIYLIDRYGLK